MSVDVSEVLNCIYIRGNPLSSLIVRERSVNSVFRSKVQPEKELTNRIRAMRIVLPNGITPSFYVLSQYQAVSYRSLVARLWSKKNSIASNCHRHHPHRMLYHEHTQLFL